MCWIGVGLGAVMMVVGLTLLLRFFYVGGVGHVQAAGAARTESMVLGALLLCIGLLLAILGATGVICTGLGVSFALALTG